MSPITNHKFIPECYASSTPWFTRFANGHSDALLLQMGYDIIPLQKGVNALTLIREKHHRAPLSSAFIITLIIAKSNTVFCRLDTNRHLIP